MAGLIPVKLGTKIQPVAIQRYKASKSHTDIVNIPTRDIFAVHMHYVQGIGSFYCWGGRCCQENGLPQTRYIAPLVVYTVRDFTRLDYGGPLLLQYLPLSQQNYEKDIVVKDSLNSDITKFDLVVNCLKEDFQDLKFDVISSQIRKWSQKGQEHLKEYVLQAYKSYRDLIAMSVARTIDEPTYDKLLAQAAARAAQGALPAASVSVPSPQRVSVPAAGRAPQLNAGVDTSDLLGVEDSQGLGIGEVTEEDVQLHVEDLDNLLNEDDLSPNPSVDVVRVESTVTPAAEVKAQAQPAAAPAAQAKPA